MRFPFIRTVGAPLAAVAMLVACASSPPPRTSETVGMAKAAVDAARDQDAATYAPDLLALAQDKVVRAERARADEDYVASTRLAQQAVLDARLAAVQADVVATQLMVEELEASVAVLEREIPLR